VRLETVLLIAAALQIGVAFMNLFIVRLLNWREDLQRMPLLLREVFTVHAWFISVTLLIFGALTWRFAGGIGTGSAEIYRWLAAGIGLFWALRTILQIAYYSSTHWRGRADRTAIHFALLLVYGGFAATYLFAAFRG